MATFHLYEDHWTRKFREPQKIYMICDQQVTTFPNRFTSWYKFAKWLRQNRNSYINPNLLSHGAAWIAYDTTKEWFRALTDYDPDEHFKGSLIGGPMVFLTEYDRYMRWIITIRCKKHSSKHT